METTRSLSKKTFDDLIKRLGKKGKSRNSELRWRIRNAAERAFTSDLENLFSRLAADYPTTRDRRAAINQSLDRCERSYEIWKAL